MNKKFKNILTYGAFALGSIFVVALFITATTYIQLALAIILYPVLAFFALKILSGRPWRINLPATSASNTVPEIAKNEPELKEDNKGDVLDIDRRTFLKLVGATGIFFFLSSLLGKRVDTMLFSKTLTSNTNIASSPPNIGVSQAGGSNSAITSGYTISEIDDGSAITYYGFTNVDGGWLVMKEDTSTNSFRYAKGATNFPSNWSNRANLKYDYYYNLF